jgi:signal transduction histidine kinase
LKTPLTSLDLDVNAMIRAAQTAPPEDQLAPKWLKKLGRVENQAKRLKLLVDDLLDVSRISSGRLELNREEVDLGPLAREVAARFVELAERSSAELEVVAQAPAIAHLDRNRIDQVITNLISNAIKYGGATPIQVRVDAADGKVRLEVRDSGPGIASVDHRRIFERFERAATDVNQTGMGLGLWISEQIVAAHRGAISVDSALGAGARFVVELPVR